MGSLFKSKQIGCWLLALGGLSLKRTASCSSWKKWKDFEGSWTVFDLAYHNFAKTPGFIFPEFRAISTSSPSTMSFSANNKSETSSPSRGDGSAVHNVEFEVHGRVQGVFFRAETEKKAKQLGLVGWVRNTDQDTVEGQIQGSKEAVDQMKDWLAHTGSRGSKIERADFKVENEVSKKEFTGFKVRH